MAVTVSYNKFRLDTAGDEINMPLIIQSIRFVAEAGNAAADVILLVDPTNTSIDLWRTFAGSATGTEAELQSAGDRSTRVWRNGVRLETLTGNNGFVYLTYA